MTSTERAVRKASGERPDDLLPRYIPAWLQHRADAMADAETLRLFDRSGGPGGTPGGVGCLAGVAIYSERAIRSTSPAATGRNAREAASYAFRAVPGLRGE